MSGVPPPKPSRHQCVRQLSGSGETLPATRKPYNAENDPSSSSRRPDRPPRSSWRLPRIRVVSPRRAKVRPRPRRRRPAGADGVAGAPRQGESPPSSAASRAILRQGSRQPLAGDYLQISRPISRCSSTRSCSRPVKSAQIYYATASLSPHEPSKRGAADLRASRELGADEPRVLGTLTSMYLQEKRPQDAERIRQTR